MCFMFWTQLHLPWQKETLVLALSAQLNDAFSYGFSIHP